MEDIFAPVYEKVERERTREQRRREAFERFIKSLNQQAEARHTIISVVEAVMCEGELRGFNRGLLSTPTADGERLYIDNTRKNYAHLYIESGMVHAIVKCDGHFNKYEVLAPGYTVDVLRSQISRAIWEFRHTSAGEKAMKYYVAATQ